MFLIIDFKEKVVQIADYPEACEEGDISVNFGFQDYCEVDSDYTEQGEHKKFEPNKTISQEAVLGLKKFFNELGFTFVC